jgi:hypothetical protein
VDDRIDNEADHLEGVEGKACWNDQLRESRDLGLQDAVNEEVAVFVIEERQQLQRYEDDKERVAVNAGSSQEKSQAKVGDNADKKKNPQRVQTDASKEKKTDYKDGCAVILCYESIIMVRSLEENRAQDQHQPEDAGQMEPESEFGEVHGKDA